MKAKDTTKIPVDINADMDFIERIVRNLTISGRLPFTVPKTHIPVIIAEAAKVFYIKSSEASEINYYAIKQADVVAVGPNRSVRLPEYIIGVTDIQEVRGASISTTNIYRRAPSLLMLNALKFTEFVNGSMSINGFSKDGGNVFYQASSYAASDALLTLYEASTFESIYQKGVRYNFNRNTSKLQLLGGVTGDLMIECHEGIELRYLYNDPNFLKYCVGKSMIDLKTILHSFDFSLIGNVKVDYNEFADRGQKMIDEVEADFEADEPGDIFMIT